MPLFPLTWILAEYPMLWLIYIICLERYGDTRIRGALDTLGRASVATRPHWELVWNRSPIYLKNLGSFYCWSQWSLFEPKTFIFFNGHSIYQICSILLFKVCVCKFFFPFPLSITLFYASLWQSWLTLNDYE